MYKVKFSLPANPIQTTQQLIDQGRSHHQAGHLDRARQCYQLALAQQPQNPDALHLIGVIEYSQGHHGRAIERIEQSLTVNPNQPAAHLNLGNAFRASGQLEAALVQYDSALALQPEYANAAVAKAVVLDELDRWSESLVWSEKALRVQGNSAVAYFNRGNGYRKRGQWVQAVSDYDRALSLHPEFTQALLNRGSVRHNQLQLRDALLDFDAAIALDPTHAEAHFNKALTLLLLGDYANGLPLHEWRWKMPLTPGEQRNFRQPLWLGQTPLAGKTILLHGEQGLGDSIQFVRYAKLLAASGAKVILEVPIPLASLLGRIEGVTSVVRRGEPLPTFDWHCPLLSLPLALGTRVETIPAEPGYIRSESRRQDRWSYRLGPRQNRPRVGLVWSGSTSLINGHNRSIPLEQLLSHLPAGPEYISLQRDVRECDQAALASAVQVQHFGPNLTDFEETAALCSLMDVVVTIDTSVAHLAGAMNRPTLLLLPFVADWRWMIDRADTPWYPSMQLLRQVRSGEWNIPLQLAAQALDKFI